METIPSFEIRAKAHAGVVNLPNQPRRLVLYLAEKPGGVSTAELARETAIGNLSHAAARAKIDLERQGIAIVAERPKRLLRNRLGDFTQQHIWHLRALR